MATPVAFAQDGTVGVDNLPAVDDSTLQGRIIDNDIDLVDDISLEDRVGDLEVESTEGSETVVRLDSDIPFEFGKSALPDAAPAQIEQLVADVPARCR